MLYTFALLRSPLKAVPDDSAPYNSYFGGPLALAGMLDTGRYARVLTLDLRDPQLSFLRFPVGGELPLLMDFAEGAIAYSVMPSGVIQLHSSSESAGESLLEGELPKQAIRLEPITYEQYRAAALSAAVIDDSYLAAEDSAALASIGENLTQVGGRQLRGASYSPYCANPSCEGHGTQVSDPLATISQEPAPHISLGFLPYDPAIAYAFCVNCHSISGVIIPD